MNKLPSHNKLDDNLTDELSSETDILSLTIPQTFAGERLDATLAKLLPDYSRSRITSWIKKGAVTVNNSPSIPKQKLMGGEKVEIFSIIDEETLSFRPEKIQLNIIYEDDDIIIIDKQANLVVHPAAGNWSGTLLNGLLFHAPQLAQVPRAGIVHRLDKNTTGLMVVAKNIIAQNHLVKQLQSREVKRLYRAITNGIVPYDGKIEALIGRDPHNKIKMAVVKSGGKTAITHIKVLKHFTNHSYIECSLETGRTHQIRVHLSQAKYSLVGDPLYGNIRHKTSDEVKAHILSFNRQALHAYKLSFIHPTTNRLVQFKSPIPDDMQALLDILTNDSLPKTSNNIIQENLEGNYEIYDIQEDDGVQVFYVRDE